MTHSVHSDSASVATTHYQEAAECIANIDRSIYMYMYMNVCACVAVCDM